MATTHAVAIEDLRFSWPGAAAPCLELERLTIDAGERVFLFGESGSGKSTLLGILGGVLVPRQGSVRVLDNDITALPSGARDRFRVDHIGFIFQQFNLIPYLSVLDNVLLPCRFSKRRQERAKANGSTMQQEALRLLAALGIDAALLGRPVTALSVGQQQRVAVARALIGRPEIIVADEPTSALDAGRQEDFLKLLLEECAASQATVLFVSHDERLASRFSREIPLAQVNRTRQAEAA